MPNALFHCDSKKSSKKHNAKNIDTINRAANHFVVPTI